MRSGREVLENDATRISAMAYLGHCKEEKDEREAAEPQHDPGMPVPSFSLDSKSRDNGS